jgi:hypothetical protein
VTYATRLASASLFGLVIVPPSSLRAQRLDPGAVDSVVLERTLCFGVCPAYRLTITRVGAVRFESRNPGDSGRTASATISVSDFATLTVLGLGSTDLAELPDRIADEPKYCRHWATDHPTVVVTVFAGTQTRRVEDYQGCMWAPASLREFENRIDSTAHSSRWVRLARGPR